MLTLAIAGALLILAYATVRQPLPSALAAATQRHPWTAVIVRGAFAWALLGVALLAFRTALWAKYRPVPVASPDRAPSMTVIIPAYNEGAMVRAAIESVVAADYPHDRLEILVVDDGSTDDTWRHISSAAARHPDLVTTTRFARNLGKRAALAEAFRRARGEVLVTIDSDSVVEPDALLAIVSPFQDPAIGAVAGKVVVYNRDEGVIPKMLHVQYVLSFDLQRAAESAYGTVYCCPGALTAYRASTVRSVLEAWESQTFLGVACTYGEDRALTNEILRAGFHTVYQRSAVVHTVVPRYYAGLCRMFLRWDRSYIREEIRFQSVVWSRPLIPRCIAIVDRWITNGRYVVTYGLMLPMWWLVADDPALGGRCLAAIGLMAAFNMMYFLASERSRYVVYGIAYAYFAAFGLLWIFPWALLTVRSRSWLTR